MKFTYHEGVIYYIAVIGDEDSTEEIELVSFHLGSKSV